MHEPSNILVTGATGKLGLAVCQELSARGHRVRATDRRFSKNFPVPIELGDLRDELFVYRVMQGCDAVVHVGNHPNQFAGPSPPQLLSENVTMNANVFHAATESGLRALVFASSVQVMIKRERNAPEPPYAIPCLPLDGTLPPNPGTNTYAQSKEFAERMLQLFVAADPMLSATSLRFPMLVTDWYLRRMASVKRVPLNWIDFAECTAHLFLNDAGRLVADVIEHRLPGYHQYFPAQSFDLMGYSVAELLSEHYPDVTKRAPIDELSQLIDVAAIAREVGWVPQSRMAIEIER